MSARRSCDQAPAVRADIPLLTDQRGELAARPATDTSSTGRPAGGEPPYLLIAPTK
jgi:hypothetical protein